MVDLSVLGRTVQVALLLDRGSGRTGLVPVYLSERGICSSALTVEVIKGTSNIVGVGNDTCRGLVSRFKVLLPGTVSIGTYLVTSPLVGLLPHAVTSSLVVKILSRTSALSSGLPVQFFAERKFWMLCLLPSRFDKESIVSMLVWLGEDPIVVVFLKEVLMGDAPLGDGMLESRKLVVHCFSSLELANAVGTGGRWLFDEVGSMPASTDKALIFECSSRAQQALRMLWAC
mmetsp:Transcript_41425/g.125420  ORF Transcript_41425/g.125420 Transcript_41425/m.125420 type:complete len:230 (-) Transcript_41425:1069-1758(-)